MKNPTLTGGEFPRGLNEELDAITTKIQGLETRETQKEPVLMTDAELRPYVLNLQETLMKGTILERKSFIRTFVKEIRIDYPNLELEYTIPLFIPSKRTPSTEEVLSLQQIGSPTGI